jgi:hypothetical protein
MIETALATFLKTVEDGAAKLLYSFCYEQVERDVDNFADSLDLAFNDGILDNVECEWKAVMDDGIDETKFMKFEERAGVNENDDDDDNDGY